MAIVYSNASDGFQSSVFDANWDNVHDSVVMYNEDDTEGPD